MGKCFRIHILFLAMAGFLSNTSGQVLNYQSFKLESQSRMEANQWQETSVRPEILLLFPDEETENDLAKGGRFVKQSSGKTLQYGFYQKNSTSYLFFDQKTKASSIFIIRAESENAIELYAKDFETNEEKISNWESAEFPFEEAESLYVKYLFDLDEDILQSNYKQSLEDFGIGVFFAPGIYHRFIKFYNGGQGGKIGIPLGQQDSIRNIEDPSKSFSVGLLFTTKIGKIALFESGLILNKSGYETPIVEDFQLGRVRYDYAYTYVDVPLAFRFYPINKGLKWYLKFGLIPQFYRSNKISRIHYDMENNEISSDDLSFSDGQFVSLNMAGVLGTGLEYSIGGNFQVYIQPSFQTMLKAFASQQFVKRYLNNKSLHVGLKYGF